jgi:hypothetical protein
MKRLDIANLKFGYWTAIERSGMYSKKKGGYSVWKCKCKCGIVKEVSLSALRSGVSTSCGCKKILNQKNKHIKSDFNVGHKTKFLTVLSREDNTKSKSGRVNKRFKVQCNCGNIFITHKQSLRKNKDLTCSDCARLNSARKMNTARIIYHWKTNEEIVCVGSYEFKVIQWLNLNRIQYTWKPKTFILPSGKKYTPDLFIDNLSSYVEIKGWWWNSKSYFDEFVNAKIGNIELWDQKKLKSMNLIK